MLIHLICAARPNFMKIAPLYHALQKEEWAEPMIVHTGQHYDLNMSDAFFRDLNLPEPDIHLDIGSGSHAEQTGRVMIAYEKVLMETKPDLVVVVGDVNSTVACTLAAAKVSYRDKSVNATNPINPRNPTNSIRPLVAHLEAGLRSFDRTMPEEINRLVTDALADILWTPSPDGDENLIHEGVSPTKIVRVGNIMIDSLEMLRNKIEKQRIYRDFDLQPKTYALVTIHRPSNVDDPGSLKKVCETLIGIAQRIPLIFPVHPRTRKNLEEYGLFSELGRTKGLFLPEPINYVRFMNLVFNCRLVITDSGGIQEETSYLGIPCLTVRESTERPVTITRGTNQLCDLDQLMEKTQEILRGRARTRKKIELWDGKAAERIVVTLRNLNNEAEANQNNAARSL